MNIIHEAFKQLYPDKELKYNTSIKYSNKFKAYNSNVRITGNHLQFNLSKKWKEIDRNICIGLIQELLIKVFKESKKTLNIELYNSFIKKLHIAAPKTETHPILEDSFNRVNNKYFYGMIEKPNLKFGTYSRTKLGSYEYQTDTITISRIFENSPQELLDYIMYHELLHKKLKFYNQSGRSYHHTAEFKKRECEFENSAEVERKIKKLIHHSSIRSLFFPKLF
jgi:hypothetical protein